MECRAGYSVKPAREDASAGLRILRMLSLKRAGEEGSATPPSDPSCPVPNTRGLPHLQGGETIVGFEDPSSRAIIPLLGQRPAVDHLPSGAERSKVCKSLHPTAKEAVSRKRPHESSCQWDQALCLACVPTTRWSGVGVRRDKAALSSGCKSHPATAPAGSNRSSHGGNEMAEAFG